MVAAKPLNCMENTASKPARQAPVIVWCVRVFFCAVILWIGRYWLVNFAGGAVMGQVVFGSLVGFSSIALIASFIHSKYSLVLIILSVIVIPLVFFLGMDIFVLRGAWWEWYMLIVQMGIPLVAAYYMWKSPGVRGYFQPARATP